MATVQEHRRDARVRGGEREARPADPRARQEEQPLGRKGQVHNHVMRPKSPAAAATTPRKRRRRRSSGSEGIKNRKNNYGRRERERKRRKKRRTEKIARVETSEYSGTTLEQKQKKIK